MHIAFNTEELSELDRRVLSAVLGDAPAPTKTQAAPAPVKTEERVTATAPQPKKAAPKPAPKAEPVEEKVAEPIAEPESEPVGDEADEDLVGGEEGPSRADVVALATKLVSSGGAPKVKDALASVGAKRVSEVTDDKLAELFAALA